LPQLDGNSLRGVAFGLAGKVDAKVVFSWRRLSVSR
jgi:hypothetical protein